MLVYQRVNPIFFTAPDPFFPRLEELMGADGRIYLRLADGRGWAFDDSTLFPWRS